jgi:hypothetical protein
MRSENMLTHALSFASTKKRLQDEETLRAEREIQLRAEEHKAKEVKEIKATLNAPLIGGLFNANLASAKKSALEKCQQELAALNEKMTKSLQDQIKFTNQMSGIYDEIVQRKPLQEEMVAIVSSLNTSIKTTAQLREDIVLKERERDVLLIECDELTPVPAEKPKKTLFARS